ncbi:MAG: peroxiredoxin family protein [Armatimonadetes bacterium]|nr:peroxiredoxin family protein [Armatimonadota bacterium]MDW8122534.1 hypothetical protein [Armatimonadota bacterium]
MRSWTVGALLGFVALGAAQMKGPASEMEGKTVPPFAAKTIDGKTVRSADFKGRVLLLVFWSPH